MGFGLRWFLSGIIVSCCLSVLFAQPEGYYDPAVGKSGEELKSILHEIIDDHNALSYAALWGALIDTDEDPADPDRFLLIYTGRSLLKTQVYPDWNREHVWAKSHGGFDNDPPAGTDLHHIKPSDVSVNGDRGNKDFDFCSTTGTRHSEAVDCYYTSYVWEPGDNIKGDVARMMLYMAVRYNGDVAGEPDLELREDIPTSGPYFGRLSSLLAWHKMDPPDAFEIRRNNRIHEAYQGNRNPFIDHPEYAELIWPGTMGQDTIRPVIDSLSIINESLITVYYSEDVVPETSLLEENYSIDNGAFINDIAHHGVSFSSVDLSVSNLFSGSYTLSVKDISDYHGNLLEPVMIPFQVQTAPVEMQYGPKSAVYPNPAGDFLIVKACSGNHKGTLTVMSASGIVFNSQFLPGEFRLDLSMLPEGIYFIRLACHTGSSRLERFIIQK